MRHSFSSFILQSRQTITSVFRATARLDLFTMPQQNLHATLKDRVEEYNLSPEEVAAIDRARGQLSSHSMYKQCLNSYYALH